MPSVPTVTEQMQDEMSTNIFTSRVETSIRDAAKDFNDTKRVPKFFFKPEQVQTWKKVQASLLEDALKTCDEVGDPLIRDAVQAARTKLQAQSGSQAVPAAEKKSQGTQVR